VLRRDDPALAGRIPALSEIIGFRNRLIHGYDMTDDALVWRILRHDLPDLHRLLDRLLHEGEG
jgi:uncharacterized protein with HEPN domain